MIVSQKMKIMNKMNNTKKRWDWDFTNMFNGELMDLEILKNSWKCTRTINQE